MYLRRRPSFAMPQKSAAKRSPQPPAAPFTNGQLAIIQLLNRSLTTKQVGDIQRLIRQYLAEQTDALGETAWQQNGYTQADMDSLLTTHVRTPTSKATEDL
jgi:hypothetical protein